MTAADYLATIARLGMTGAQCADLFGYTRQIHYSKWSKDGPPKAVAMCLRTMEKLGHTSEQFKAFAS